MHLGQTPDLQVMGGDLLSRNYDTKKLFVKQRRSVNAEVIVEC